MSFPISTRSRWVRWCCFITFLMASFVFVARNPSRFLSSKSKNSIRSASDNLELDLIPTLVDARELESIANPNSLSKSEWNPEPQWNQVLTSAPGMLPSLETRALAAIGPIPDAFPLEPRHKKEPPAIGDALVSAHPTVGQLQPLESQGFQPVSPFLAKSVSPAIENNFAPQRRASPTLTLGQSQALWPDQTFAPSTSLKQRALTETELLTPHLLTGTIVRPNPASPAPTNPVQLLPFESRPNKPPTGNYILQPIRKKN